ncbi:MAG: Fic family protein [Succinimonas sp.]|nr:Fic family protein [Succinimonas sp.]
MYIYDNQEWPNFRWDEHKLAKPLFEIAFLMGSIIGKINSLDFAFQKEVILASMTDEIVNSSRIEGVQLNYQEVRSAVARKFDIPSVPETEISRYVDGIVEMMMDVRCNYDAELTLKRLCGWQAALFHGALNGRYHIKTGELRDDKLGPMQIVSSVYGSDKVYFQAPAAERLPSLMNEFLKWIARDSGNPLIRAALAHLWFVTIHPFEDGNGRVARAITELMLARADKSPLRFYSISRQIFRNREEYYLMLERAEKGDLDITAWLLWFLNPNSL